MLALSILDIRDFMAKLLKDEVFDDFQLRNAVVNTFARFEIYGTNDDGCAAWGLVRPHVFGAIKGDKPPKSIKIILGKDMGGVDMENPVSGFVNIHFEEGKAGITTGISKKGFSLDRFDDEKWDAQVMEFLDNNKITYKNEI
ncbi:MAG: DUF5721 family protein [Defluviitaleaceae bacterium]|nr:DUF5721 family protein [Defluviitaleaceae bacterium]